VRPLDLSLLSAERRLAFTTLFAAAIEESTEDWKRRSAAINAITALQTPGAASPECVSSETGRR